MSHPAAEPPRAGLSPEGVKEALAHQAFGTTGLVELIAIFPGRNGAAEGHHQNGRRGGDSGRGAPDLGYVDNTNAYGVALPQDQLNALLGPKADAYRTARLRLTINGQTFQVPITDYGPSEGQQKKNVVSDATYPLSQALGGFDWTKATNLGIVKNAGPDYKTNRAAWDQEQAQLRALLSYARGGEPAPTPDLTPPPAAPD